MLEQYDKITEAADAIRARYPDMPAVGIILGSGLGGIAGSIATRIVARARGPGGVHQREIGRAHV